MNVCKICGEPCPDKYDTCWIHRHGAALDEHDERLNNHPRDKPACGPEGCEIYI